MKEATVKNLRDAFSNDCMAKVRYLIFAGSAMEEDFPGISRLLRGFSMSRYIRATDHYRMTGEMLGEYRVCTTTYFILERTMDNLIRARDAERALAKETLTAYLAVADYQHEERAAKSLQWSIEVSKSTAALLGSVLETLDKEAREPAIGAVFVCQGCGHVAILAPPETCPVCAGNADGYLIVD